MGLAEKAVETAIERGAALAEKYLLAAVRAPKDNIEACVKYLRAAQVAIEGLETEADEILRDSKLVALFDWERRSELYARIDTYLHVDRLRTLLDKSLEGMRASYNYAKENSGRFFQSSSTQAHQRLAVESILSLIQSATQYLESLSGAMGYSSENYAGPSGIHVEELLQIQQHLGGSPKERRDSKIREEIIDLATRCQARRVKHGLQIVHDASGAIQQLSTAFRIDAPKE